jgi:NADH-quinone oxidoreductase subunit K
MSHFAIPLSNYLILGSILFAISIAGLVLNRRNLITILMCIELLLLAVNTNFIAFADYLHKTSGEVFVFFVLTVAAAEAAIGLAIVITIFRNRKTILTEDLDSLKG